MEPTRFDDFTKVLATPTSRRQALKAIAATTMGGMLGLSGMGKVFAAAPCSRGQCRNRDCCTGLFCDQTAHTCVACIPSGHRGCRSVWECCPGLVCDTDTSTCVDCIPSGDRGCRSDMDCCPEFFCDQTTLTCVSCIPSGHTGCLSNGQCCSNNCDWATETCQ
jgi:hypothetical protein